MIRHAKSSWDSKASNDFDRPLNERGKTDAPEMARRLIKKHIRPDLFVSSPAKRARRTAELFCAEFDFPVKDISELYHADQSIFQALLSRMDDRYVMAAIFSHNPAITEYANTLTTIKADDMPTCGIFAVSSEVDSWAGFVTAEKKFLFFDYPKLL